MKDLRSLLLSILAFALLISTASCNQAAVTPTAIAAPIATSAPTALTATITPTAVSTIQPGDSTRKLTVNGLNRDYLIHIPPGLDRSRAVPVVLGFSAFGDPPSVMQDMTGFNEIADKNGFIIVYPKGTGASDSDLSWNAGGECCGSAATNNVDEAAFIRQILSDLGTIASIDTKRIYAVGFSNGAALVHRLACEMSDTFAAIAPVSGVLLYNPCQPQQPVSVIQAHGLADTLVPYAGGGDFHVLPVEKVIATWAQLDGCAGSAEVEGQRPNVTHTVYASCRAGTAVELYTIRLGEHEWPSSYLPISKIIWDFFAAHPKS